MIINSITTRNQSNERIVRFDDRFTTPARFHRILDNTGYLSLFLSRSSVLEANDIIASVAISVSPMVATASQQPPVQRPGLGLLANDNSATRQSGIVATIQGMASQRFRAASLVAASSIMTAKMSIDTVRANLTVAYDEYVLPQVTEHGSVATPTPSQYYDTLFVERLDPGSVTSRAVGGRVEDTALLTIDDASISGVNILPEWLLITLTSYDGNGVYVGKDAVRVATRTLLLEHDTALRRKQRPPTVTAQLSYENPGQITLAVVAEGATKLYSTDLDPGSVLQDSGKTVSQLVGAAPGNGTALALFSNHLAQSNENASIYRAVDSLGRFAGVLLGGQLSTSCVQASLSLSRTSDGVLVEMLNIPPSIAYVKIFRRANTVDQLFDSSRPDSLVFSEQTTGLPIDLSFTDRLEQSVSNVARPTNCTYYAVCTDNKGNETKTRESTILLDPSSGAVGFAKPVVTGLTTRFVQASNTFDVSFQLTFDITQETTTADLLKILTAQGIVQYYSDDIDPARLAELVTAKVVLRNMISGQEINLGIHGQNALVTASGLTPSYYKLEMITTIRKPETSIDSFVATGFSTPRAGLGNAATYQYRPSVTMNPAGILNGTIVPSGSKDQPNAAYEKYTGDSALVGFFVDATYLPLDLLAASKPTIVQKQMTGVPVTPALERVSWQIDKPTAASSISHFTVWRSGELRGVIAGAATNNGTYSFFDTPATAAANGQYQVFGWLFDGTVMAGSDTLPR